MVKSIFLSFTCDGTRDVHVLRNFLSVRAIISLLVATTKGTIGRCKQYRFPDSFIAVPRAVSRIYFRRVFYKRSFFSLGGGEVIKKKRTKSLFLLILVTFLRFSQTFFWGGGSTPIFPPRYDLGCTTKICHIRCKIKRNIKK